MYSFIHISPLSIRRQTHTQRTTCSRRPRACTQHTPKYDDVKEDLLSGNQPKQLLALISLPKLAVNDAVKLLNSSQVLESPNPQIRLTALATLGKLGEKGEAHSLMGALKNDGDYTVRSAAASGLGALFERQEMRTDASDEVSSVLAEAARGDEHYMVRYVAIVSLGSLGGLGDLGTLSSVAMDSAVPSLEASAALRGLGEAVKPEEVSEEMWASVEIRSRDRDEFVRTSVAKTLADWHTVGNSRQVLRRMSEEEDRFGQSAMVRAVLDELLGKLE